MRHNLAQPFYESACQHPSRLAVYADGEEFTYREVLERAVAIANWLRAGDALPRRVGILASRSAEACIGILAAAWAGAAYVAINLALPEAAMVPILRRSGVDALIADRNGSKKLTATVLQACPPKVLARREQVPNMVPAITCYDDLPRPASMDSPVSLDPAWPAYIEFTSGSTGVPKGVIIPVGGVEHYLGVLESMYPLTPDDRVAETSPTSFDISVHNMFTAWRAGASLNVIPDTQSMAPAKFLKDRGITAMMLVPSVGSFMARMGLLKPGAFPSLKTTIFAGEPLLCSVAAAWQVAAPSSVIVNMYGPTEATVVCLAEQYGPGGNVTRDCVAIGRPFDGMKAAIAAPELTFAPDGTSGEILLAGPQLALGYLDDPEKTRARFVEIEGERWYRTGDLGRRDPGGVFHYLGRMDNQVKVLGNRVELEDIESHLREVSGCNSVAAVAWPLRGGSAAGIVAFLAGYADSTSSLKSALQQRLAAYMAPAQIHVLPELPLNSNGKVDRKALTAWLDERHARAAQP